MLPISFFTRPWCRGQGSALPAACEPPSGWFRQESHRHRGISCRQHGSLRYLRCRCRACRRARSVLVMMSETFIFLPFTAVGTPFSKVMVTYSAFIRSFFRSNAKNQQMIVVWLVGRILQLQTFMADVPQVAVTAVAVNLRRTEDQCRVLCSIRSHLHGTACSSVCHSRQGAMIFRSGASALMPSSKRIWSFPLPVAPWQMAAAPSFRAISTSFFAMQRTCHGSTEQVFVLVYSVCLYARNDVVVSRTHRQYLQYIIWKRRRA